MIIFKDYHIGLVILFLWWAAGLVYFFSPGSVRIQVPQGGCVSWLYSVIHLSYEIILLPATAVYLLTGRPEWFLWSRFSLAETIKALFIVFGFCVSLLGVYIFCWSRILMGGSFRLAAVEPRRGDYLTVRGPYRYIGNPIYASVLCMCIGLALLTRMYIFIVLCVVLFVLQTAHVIPIEERHLASVHGERYIRYQRSIKKIIPFVY